MDGPLPKYLFAQFLTFAIFLRKKVALKPRKFLITLSMNLQNEHAQWTVIVFLLI
jgi:hypothetical protein